jgi:preprotein translocase subunit SecA
MGSNLSIFKPFRGDVLAQEKRREYQRRWMRKKRRLERDKKAARVVLYVPMSLKEKLSKSKPADVSFARHLLQVLSLSCEGRLATGQAVSPPKVGRNDLCPCGSGQKFKRCCLK